MTRRLLNVCVAGVIALWQSPTGEGFAQTVQELDAKQTVVVANKNTPEAIDVARHYMSVRNIPSNHLCVVDLPTGETMSRWNYEHKLRDPLQAFLREQGLIEQVRREEGAVGRHDNPWRTIRNQVRYIVPVYGVPIRIAETRPYLLTKITRLADDPLQRDGAATDSELACLLWESYSIKGMQANPYYNMVNMSRYQRGARPVLMIGRLDGPDLQTVRRMIDDTLDAEKYGLNGRAYIDYRQVRDLDYYLGDYWIKEAGARLHRAGFEVTYDQQESLFPADFPMENPAFYFGWYAVHAAGPFVNPGFRFRTGAVAYHLHSSSAKSLRTTSQYWAGPLLAAGAVAVMGAVDEPYLSYTPDLQIFTDRLLSGYSYGESACYSLRVLSWQVTLIGDPLYRPFLQPVDVLSNTLKESEHSDLEWMNLRRINFLLEQQQFNLALAYGRELIRQGDSLVIREKLADLYAKNELWNEALREYQWIVEHAATDVTAVRVGHRLILLQRLLKRGDEAERMEKAIREKWPDSLFLSHLDGATP